MFGFMLNEKITWWFKNRKDDIRSNAAYLSLSINMNCVWHLDSGSSRHMTHGGSRLERIT